MSLLAPADPLAVTVVRALRTGDLDALTTLLEQSPALVTARAGDQTASRSLLHVVTDWPGHFPRVAETVATLVASGADPDVRFPGPHREMTDVIGSALVSGSVSPGEQLDLLLWRACRGGRFDTARRLHEAGADPDVVAPWQPQTPWDAGLGQRQPRRRDLAPQPRRPAARPAPRRLPVLDRPALTAPSATTPGGRDHHARP